jgi:DNA (cytosine-5)-methyltransferase 1
MKVGSQYPEAYQVALKRFEYELRKCNGGVPSPNSAAYNLLLKQIVPPYDPAKFPNKWWKLVPTMPSKTLTAHISKDTYSHIHYDSRQARTISVREAARLQSFPDGFVFAGAMNAAFRQIGNAVPPLLAYAIAKQVKRELRKASG